MEDYLDISDVLETFDIKSVEMLLKGQINSGSTELDSTIQINHFNSLYVAYNEMVNSEADEDIKTESKYKFMEICDLFLKEIGNKYGFSISQTYLDENEEYKPAITLALYSIFVLDLKKNLVQILFNYITKPNNYKKLTEAFESPKGKSATLKSEKNVIIAKIYDVTEWCLDNIASEEFVSLLDGDYAFAPILNKLLIDGDIEGDFMTAISEVYKSSYMLRGAVCIELGDMIKQYELK